MERKGEKEKGEKSKMDKLAEITSTQILDKVMGLQEKLLNKEVRKNI